MEVNFQADINWLQQEVAKIKDPKFLATVVELLRKRPSAKEEDAKDKALRAEYTKHALESRKDIKEGRLLNINEAKEYLSTLDRPWK